MMKENYPEDVYENAEKETMQNLKNAKKGLSKLDSNNKFNTGRTQRC